MATRYATKLDDDVKAVLLSSDITAASLTLPRQLNRTLYEKVNKVLVAVGGKWNRKAQAHLFPSDPRVILGLAVASGEIVDEGKVLQQFFTPPTLAMELAEWAGVCPRRTVLEPSAGAGALAMAARARGGLVDCIEIDGSLVDTLRTAGFATSHGDFLAVAPPAVVDQRYDIVLMNPPFSGQQDTDHVIHALGFLKPKGRLVAVMSPSAFTRQAVKASAFRVLLDGVYNWCVREVPAGTFKASGTNIATTVLIADAP